MQEEYPITQTANAPGANGVSGRRRRRRLRTTSSSPDTPIAETGVPTPYSSFEATASYGRVGSDTRRDKSQVQRQDTDPSGFLALGYSMYSNDLNKRMNEAGSIPVPRNTTSPHALIREAEPTPHALLPDTTADTTADRDDGDAGVDYGDAGVDYAIGDGDEAEVDAGSDADAADAADADAADADAVDEADASAIEADDRVSPRTGGDAERDDASADADAEADASASADAISAGDDRSSGRKWSWFARGALTLLLIVTLAALGLGGWWVIRKVLVATGVMTLPVATGRSEAGTAVASAAPSVATPSLSRGAQRSLFELMDRFQT